MCFSLSLTLLCTIFTFLLGLNNAEASAAMVNKSVAVVNFTMTGQTSDEDWSAGLADFTLAMLQEQGIVSFERSQLRYLFEENRLQEQGLTKPEQIVQKKLPWVRYLVNGSISKDNNTDFTFTLYLTDMRNGQEAGRYSNKGKYPDELAHAVTTLAMLASEQINSGGEAPPASAMRRERPGFTNSPEVALFYYKGLDHYFSGRPGYAEYYFRLATHLDPSFFIAAQWRARSYEQLGLRDFSDLLNQQLLTQTSNDFARFALNRQKQKTKGQLVVSIIPPSNPKEQDQLLEQLLRKIILADPTLQLFSHKNIASVAEEIDRGLSNSFNRHQLGNQEWLSSDGLFSISFERVANTQKKIRIRFIDSRSGRIVIEKMRKINTSEQEVTIQQMVREIRDKHIMVTDRGGNRNAGIRYPLAPIDKKEGRQFQWTPVENEARGIRMMADNPENLEALFSYLQVIMGYDMVEKGHSPPYVKLVLDRLDDLIDLNSEEAPFWLYTIQWKRIYLRWFDPWYQSRNGMVEPRKDGALFEHMFDNLIKRYPNSFPGLLARYSVAIDKIYSGNTKLAFTMLKGIADKIALNPYLAQMQDPFHQQPIGSQQHEVAAVLYFLSAKCALAIGKSDKAATYATKARRSLEHFYSVQGLPATSQYPRVFPAIYGLQKFEASWLIAPVPLPPDMNVRDGFHEEIDGIFAQAQGSGKSEHSIDQLRDKLNSQLSREEVARVSSQLLEQISTEVQGNNLQGYDNVSRNSARRLVSATRETKWKQTSIVLDKLITAFQNHYRRMSTACPDGMGKCSKVDSGTGKKISFPYSILTFDGLMLDLYLIGERFDLLNSLSRNLLHSRYSKRRIKGIRYQAWLLYETKSPRSSAEFLLGEVARWEKGFPDTRGRDYVELLSWCGQTFVDAGDEQRALQVYKRGVKETSKLANAKYCNDRELAGSMMYQQAILQAKHNDQHSAVRLFKEVVHIGENCEIYSLNRITERKKQKGSPYSTIPMFAGRNGMLEMAVNKIEHLRSGNGE